VADGLRRLDGVADVTVDLQQNICEVTPVRDRAPDFAGLPAAVHAAGFRPGRLWLRAHGTVAGTSFRIRGFARELPVRGERPAGDSLTALVDLQPPVTLVPATAPVLAGSAGR
jgi:hypothetical protein